MCEQYLKKLFGNSVISYRTTRKLNKVLEGEGKIFIFGTSKISELSNLKYDLFWNAVSFQEMEPNIVENYLKHVNSQTQKYVFLQEKKEGKDVAITPEGYGVQKKTKFEHYSKGLKDFKPLNISDVIRLPQISYNTQSCYSIWKREK